MELATAALSSLLPKLATLLTDEYKLQKGVRGEIKFLHAEMESMQAVLNVVSKQPAHQISDLDKIWVRDLRELSYDIEDSVDTFMVRVDGAPVSAKPHIATDIEDIKRRIHEVSDRLARYKPYPAAVQSDTMVIDSRLPAKLVGIDGPVDRLVNLLTQGRSVQKQKPMVVSIFGVGGLGKTTIANSVYKRLGAHFECQAFVSVSLRPNMKQILSSILRQVTKDNAGEKEPDELIRSIRNYLTNKRYIIVIDDVWDESSWKVIKCALIDNDLDSRVIVTTRNSTVAKFSCSPIDGAMFQLDPLNDTDSRELFRRRIFSENEEIHSELEDVSQKILNKCGGVPLAIITIASMLACIPYKTKYEWYGVYRSMGSGLAKDKTLENMRGILSLSYGDLPSYLKPCLLCLSVFPEDYKIPKDRLVRMWVAEGFVDEKQGSNLYDLGDSYFIELVNRSMIQPVDMDEFGSARACRVHDMILDLTISLSAEENFVTISEGRQVISPAHKIRRLSLQGNKIDSNEEDTKEEKMVLPPTVNVSHVRSIIASGDASHWMPPLSMFSALRVFSLEQFPSKNNDPKVLGTLHHLRYLELGGELETEHLEEIGNLQLLKTLDLRATTIEELPASIVKLRQLECLIVNWRMKFPDGIGNLTSLQQLSELSVRRSPNTLAELGKLTELRELDIYGLDKSGSYVKTFLKSLSNLENIHTLNSDGTESFCLDCTSDGWRAPRHLRSFDGGSSTLSKLPRWFSSLSKLSCLSIKVKVLRRDDLQLLGALPVLRFLKLLVAVWGSTEERLVMGPDQPFRSLTEFKFEHLSRCWLVFAQGAMPKLQRLQLYFEARKREGGGIDVGLENLASLKHVAIKVDCEGARIREVHDVETRIKDAIGMHPNHPTLELSRWFERRAKAENEDSSKASNQQSGDLLSANDETDNESDVSEHS
ncbi:hypothetical protein ACP70R_003669 [Stipagrostis hirtigluma subsp. patula]